MQWLRKHCYTFFVYDQSSFVLQLHSVLVSDFTLIYKMPNNGKVSSFQITLIRHGQTVQNSLGIVQGHMDTQLNNIGIEQAQLLASKIAIDDYQLVYSSDLARAFDTARQLVCGTKNGFTCEMIRIDQRLRERSLGSCDGKKLKVFLDQCSAANKHPDDFTPEGGQTLNELQIDVVDFIQNRILPDAVNVMKQSNNGCEIKILIVSHGITIREFIKHLRSFGDNRSWPSSDHVAFTHSPPNTSASVFRVHIDTKSEQISTVECICLHDLSHLEGDLYHDTLNFKRKFLV